jgi:hypothetical protein
VFIIVEKQDKNFVGCFFLLLSDEHYYMSLNIFASHYFDCMATYNTDVS